MFMSYPKCSDAVRMFLCSVVDGTIEDLMNMRKLRLPERGAVCSHISPATPCTNNIPEQVACSNEFVELHDIAFGNRRGSIGLVGRCTTCGKIYYWVPYEAKDGAEPPRRPR